MITRQIIDQSDFKTGVIDPNFMGQEESVLYQHGLKKLDNCIVRLEGTVERRPGLQQLKKLPNEYANHADDVRLLPCQWSQTMGVMVVAKPRYGTETGTIIIYDKDGAVLSTFYHFYSAQVIADIKATDSALGTVLCQETIAPLIIYYNAQSGFEIKAFDFSQDDNSIIQMPFEKFVTDISMSASAAAGTITLNSTADYFISPPNIVANQGGHVGVQLKLFGGVINITNVISKRQATATVLKTLSSFVSANRYTKDFTEQAFSAGRSWPRVGISYQGRLIFGGSKHFGNKIWMSQLGQYNNFDQGTSAQGDAIAFNIGADQAEVVQWLAAGRYLEIYTNLAEWSCPIESLSPTSLSLVRQSRYGIASGNNAAPLVVEGKTIFLGRDRTTVHQLQWSDLNKGYQHNSLNDQAKTLTQNIRSLHYDPYRKLLYGQKSDGTLAVMTYYQEQQIFAWGSLSTDGIIKAVVGGWQDNNQPYFLVKRGDGLYIETLPANSVVIADGHSKKAAVADRQTTITIDSFLQGKNVALYQDGLLKKVMTLANNPTITLPNELEIGKDFFIGLVFTSTLQPLHRFSGPGGAAGFAALKLSRLSFLVKDTPALCWQKSNGLQFPNDIKELLLDKRSITASNLLNGQALALQPYSGWAVFSLSGWRQEIKESLWQLVYNNPYPLLLLSVKEEYLISTPN